MCTFPPVIFLLRQIALYPTEVSLHLCVLSKTIKKATVLSRFVKDKNIMRTHVLALLKCIEVETDYILF